MSGELVHEENKKVRALTISSFKKRFSAASINTTRAGLEILGEESFKQFGDLQADNLSEYVSNLQFIIDDDYNSEAERYLDASNIFFEKCIDNFYRIADKQTLNDEDRGLLIKNEAENKSGFSDASNSRKEKTR